MEIVRGLKINVKCDLNGSKELMNGIDLGDILGLE